MKKKVLVLGLDGLEPSIVESMMGRGELPNFAKLKTLGSYGRLQTTYPAQTPVAWSTFATGTNPGGHGIFDFICRNPETYQPDLALSRFERPKSMLAQPRVVSRRRGMPIWQVLAKAGVPSTVLRCPCTFPPDADSGRILAGVGTPDLRGGQGTGTFYTQDKSVEQQENEQLVYLEQGDNLRTHVIGPRNTRVKPVADLTSEIRVRVDQARRQLLFETGGAPSTVEIAEKSWGPWIRVKFKLSMLQSVSGLVRFYVRQLSPHLEFYASPVNFDPAAPLFPVSAPADYARQLAEGIGPFSTLGMAEDHTGHNNGRFDEDAFCDQCALVLEEREKMMWFELERFSEGFFFVLFDTPDRFQHMFWRFRDREHPSFNPELAAKAAYRIEELYQRCDKLLGRVLENVDENTLLVVLSDHGFGSFRRSFDTNTWLWQQGLLALKNGRKPGEELNGFAQVDWTKTYAYAVGLGGIYLNLRGRESAGILEQNGEAERVRKAIEEGLTGAADAQTQRPAVCSVSRREKIYSGAYVGDAPDLLVNFNPGFRVSWQSAMGGFANSLLEDNTRRWSGDHIVDPTAVPGILLLNRVGRRETARMIDLAPTILGFLDVPPTAAMEGQSLL
ncbi:MAG TPA: alkaline phosphatase family protein [Terriglobales bacterium]|nr:alkaline phosphatase family protein [Terriglobales bacterium]